MNKTKVEKEVDHEQERVDRIKQENAVKRAAAAERVSEVLEGSHVLLTVAHIR
jgi:hypothetical protein